MVSEDQPTPGAAGLEEGVPQWLAYGPSVRKDYVLLEVDRPLLADLEENGCAFKSQPDGTAVLCTSKATYQVKTVETTNLLLLIPPAEDPRDIENRPPCPDGEEGRLVSQGGAGLLTQAQQSASADDRPRITVTATADRHLEVVRTSPKLSVLRDLLMQTPYKPPQAGPTSEDKSNGFTWEELLRKVPCSELELREALAECGALQHGGRWSMVDQGYLTELLHMILLSAVEHDWPMFALPGAAAVSALEPDGFEAAVILHCLAVFSEDPAESDTPGHVSVDSTLVEAKGGTSSWTLDAAKVCSAFARALLQTRVWQQDEFMEAWRRAVPCHDLSPDTSMLRGIAILEQRHGTWYVKRLDANELPSGPRERFNILFNEKSAWLLEDLQPYLKGLEAGGLSEEALLLKFSRAVQKSPQDPVSYTAR